ncbi:MAG: hypothetical protein AMXMBFR61_17750 [Fimbriimonadales bacterium]
MFKLRAACAAIILSICAAAFGSDAGIVYGKGRLETHRKTDAAVDFWVASASQSGVYGRFWFVEWHQGQNSNNYAVEISLNRFAGFGCNGNSAAFGGPGYLNGTPRYIVAEMLDGGAGPDLILVGAFHPVSMTLLYDRYCVFRTGGLTVLCRPFG